MSSKANNQAAVFDEICFAAFSTHFRTVFAAKLTDKNAHDVARKHWNDNLPHIGILWRGLAMALVNNVTDAQKAGKLPPLAMHGQPAATALPGLGAPQAVDTGPAALARRLAGEIRAREAEAAGVVPGLAVGRATGDE